MNDAPAIGLTEPTPPSGGGWPDDPKRREGWTRGRWLMVIALIFFVHVSLICMFGARQEPVPRTVAHVPTLTLTKATDELVALTDPTVFALPNQHDFASAVWLKKYEAPLPSFTWTEDPHWLPLSPDRLGMVLIRFTQTNQLPGYPLDFKPPPRLAAPAALVETTLPQVSTLRLEGDLARRPLLDQIFVPSPACNDVIAPTVIQALVDAAGHIVSTVVLTSSGLDSADQRALELARAARFFPAAEPTMGRIVFIWHTVPAPVINTPAVSP